MDVRPKVEVIIPPLPKHAAQAYTIAHTISVQHALQFTPLMTSILPAHDRIPLPQICRPRESTRLTTSNERKQIQTILKDFPINILEGKLTSLLAPKSLSEFKFRRSPAVSPGSSDETRGSTKKPEYVVSKVAHMILDSTSIDYEYPSPTQSIKQRTSPVLTQALPDRLVTPLVKTEPQLFSPVSSFKLTTPDLPTPRSNPVSAQKEGSQPILIDISKPPSTFHREDYIEIQDDSKRRKLSHEESNLENAAHARSQRQASDAALLQFQNLTMEVFEAQDQLDAGVTDSTFFDILEDGESSEPRLSLRTLERLTTCLKKLTTLKRMSDVSIEHLRRLQILCEASIDRSQTINLRLLASPTSEDEEDWRRRLSDIEVGVASAALCLLTIIGCPHDESLLSTEARLWIPNVLVNLFETCLIPVIESRPEGQDSDLFSIATSNKDILRRLLESGKKLLDLMTSICVDVKGTITAINPVEFLCTKLIFVQNANADRTSCLGIQTFEKVRKSAMSSLARIYARFPAERRTILNEILTSLDRLPSNSRSARQYRLSDGKSVQLITALFVQLVQTTAMQIPVSKNHVQSTKRPNGVDRAEKQEESDEEDVSQSDDSSSAEATHGPIDRVRRKADSLFDESARSATDIVKYLVSRASKTTKTGDSPYRNVFDLFVEDLIAMLPSPEWPASELMLRMLSQVMTNLANNDKSAASKNMALESLGIMGSAISVLRSSVADTTAALEREGQQQSKASKILCQLASIQENQGNLQSEDILSLDGPLAIVTRQLSGDMTHSVRSRSACGYFVAHYAKLLSLSKEAELVDQRDTQAPRVRVANWLLDLITKIGANSFGPQDTGDISSEEADLAYTLCILNLGFCGGLHSIGKTLTGSFSSDSAQVRSRSLKSVQTILEKDTWLLTNASIVESVFKCATDDSAMVRDAALSLIAKFIISRPGLQQRGIKLLLECASDDKVGVQKKAMSHLREIYIHDTRKDLKAIISHTFLQRTKDHEDTVADLARKMLTELWISPVATNTTNTSDTSESKRRIAIQDLTAEIVRCTTYNAAEMSILLQKYLISTLKVEVKAAAKLRELYLKIVEELFEKVVSGSASHGYLETLAAFAAAEPKLIPPERLAKLKHYLADIKTDEDLFLFRSVIDIFRHVLPDLSVTQQALLKDVQVDLLKSITSLGRRVDLDPLMMCVWTIEGALGNPARIVNLTASIFAKIKAFQNNTPNVARLLRIAGAIGRYMDLDAHTAYFATKLNEKIQGGTISTHMAYTFLEHTKPLQPLEIRTSALESLGSLCQANPVLFGKQDIRRALFAVFKKDQKVDVREEAALQHVVLSLFDSTYASRAQTRGDIDETAEETNQQELGKLGGDSRTRDGDSAVVSITGEVVTCVLHKAMTSGGESALLATRTLASISHEGLIHPKQSTGAFVALSTSSEVEIADIASKAQRLLHQTHESVCEREYMQAVQQAFLYQQTVTDDTCGARPNVYVSKLAKCFEIINSSSTKYVKKFLSGLVSRIANDIATRDKKILDRQSVEFARFILQNLAFFEYSRLDDLLHTILQIELAYSKSGGEIVQLLEPSLLRVTQSIEQEPDQGDLMGAQTHGEVQAIPVSNMENIRDLAPVVAVLTLLIETRAYLRRQYGVGQDVRAAINSSKQAKDGTKGLIKVHGITGERVWNKTNSVVLSLDSEAGMVACCEDFVTSMTVAEADVEADHVNVEVTDVAPARGGTPAARKRKGSASVGNTPVKKARGRPRKEIKRGNSISSMEDPDADFDD